MALPRLFRVEGGSMIRTGCTSAGTLNGDEEFADADNGVDVVGRDLVQSECDETSFIKDVVVFAAAEEGACGEFIKCTYPKRQNNWSEISRFLSRLKPHVINSTLQEECTLFQPMLGPLTCIITPISVSSSTYVANLRSVVYAVAYSLIRMRAAAVKIEIDG
ncbi:hypothetical protein FQA39_LY14785 [Lamprigera yunnana]|nr:hypothetical protein FQA39_LY14785 [Lamprigera yunnana]